MNLSSLKTLSPQKSKKRVGRGIGSGKGGHTSGRGNKGQAGREKVRLNFEGGQTPFYKRLPKKIGFHHGRSHLLVTPSQLEPWAEMKFMSKKFLVAHLVGKSKRSKIKTVKVVDDGRPLNFSLSLAPDIKVSASLKRKLRLK